MSQVPKDVNLGLEPLSRVAYINVDWKSYNSSTCSLLAISRRK